MRCSKKVDFIRFKSDLLLSDAKNDPIKKAELVKDILGTVSVISDEVKRSIYMSEVSSMFEIGEKALYNELNKTLRKLFNQERRINNEPEENFPNPQYKDNTQQPKYSESGLNHLEKDIIRLLLNYGEREVVFFIKNEETEEMDEVATTAANYIVVTLVQDEIKFDNQVFQKIFDHYKALVEEESEITNTALRLNQDAEIVETVVSLVSTKYELSENWKVHHKIYVTTEDMKLRFALEHAVLAMQLKRIELEIQEIQVKLKEVPEEEEVLNLLTSQLTLIELKKIVSDKLNRVILK